MRKPNISIIVKIFSTLAHTVFRLFIYDQIAWCWGLSGSFSFLDSSPWKQNFSQRLRRREFSQRILSLSLSPLPSLSLLFSPLSRRIQYDMHSKTILPKRAEGSPQTKEVLFTLGLSAEFITRMYSKTQWEQWRRGWMKREKSRREFKLS